MKRVYEKFTKLLKDVALNFEKRALLNSVRSFLGIGRSYTKALEKAFYNYLEEIPPSFC